jgi:hypothetical protein
VQSKEFVQEASPDTLAGSFTDDLIDSKVWLCSKLKEGLGNKCARTVYILGSWFGNLALLIKAADIVFDKIVLIDTDENALSISEELLRPFFNPGQLVFINTDACDVIYDSPGIVINTSVNDMSYDWYDNVPKGMRIAVQARNGTEFATTRIPDMEQFNDMFPMQVVSYLGSKDQTDPETDYTRFMKIGKR